MTHKECNLLLSKLIQENPDLRVKFYCEWDMEFDEDSYEVNYIEAPEIKDIYCSEDDDNVYFEYEELEEELMDRDDLSNEDVEKIIAENYKIMRCIVVSLR